MLLTNPLYAFLLQENQTGVTASPAIPTKWIKQCCFIFCNGATFGHLVLIYKLHIRLGRESRCVSIQNMITVNGHNSWIVLNSKLFWNEKSEMRTTNMEIYFIQLKSQL